MDALLIDAVRRDRCRVDAKDLIARHELIPRRDLDAAADAVVDAVQRVFVTDDEVAVAIEEVRVTRRDELVIRKFELPRAPQDVLLRLEVIAEAIHPVAADQDEPRLVGVLHVAEVAGLPRHHVFGHRRPAAAAELVAVGDARHARPTDVVFSLIHPCSSS